MLLQVLDETQGGPGARPLGILDSPTLARVERAMLRHGGADREGQDVARAQYTQSLLSAYGKDSATATAPVHVIKRGLLWQQRDRLFSRWKERYFVLTRDYLHCFRRASGSDRISEMGQFLFKVKLVDVARVEWENKKTYSTVALVVGRDGKIYLRSADGLEDWFELLEECTVSSKERRRALRYSHNDGGKPTANNNNISSSLDEWIAARQKIQMGRLTTDSVSTRPEVVRRRIRTPREEDWEPPNFDNRLSLLTDIDLADCDSSACSTLGAASSVTSYRHSDDVFCVQPPSLRAMASFRSAAPSSGSTTPAPEPQGRRQYFKFRERSYSDIQRV